MTEKSVLYNISVVSTNKINDFFKTNIFYYSNIARTKKDFVDWLIQIRTDCDNLKGFFENDNKNKNIPFIKRLLEGLFDLVSKIRSYINLNFLLGVRIINAEGFRFVHTKNSEYDLLNNIDNSFDSLYSLNQEFNGDVNIEPYQNPFLEKVSPIYSSNDIKTAIGVSIKNQKKEYNLVPKDYIKYITITNSNKDFRGGFDGNLNKYLTEVINRNDFVSAVNNKIKEIAYNINSVDLYKNAILTYVKEKGEDIFFAGVKNYIDYNDNFKKNLIDYTNNLINEELKKKTFTFKIERDKETDEKITDLTNKYNVLNNSFKNFYDDYKTNMDKIAVLEKINTNLKIRNDELVEEIEKMYNNINFSSVNLKDDRITKKSRRIKENK